MAALAAALVGALAFGGSPATGAVNQTAAPTLSTRAIAGQTVLISGRIAPVRGAVRIDRKTASRWVVVKRLQAHAHRYVVRMRQGVRVAQYRAAYRGRASRVVTIRMPAPVATDACGSRPAKADGTRWSCTFHDDFAGTTLDRSKWVPQTVFATGVGSASACYLDDPSTVNVANGSLNLTVRPRPTLLSCLTGDYVAGMVTTHHLFSQQYGRFEARVRNTATTHPGLQEAFWLWPDDRVPSTVVWPWAGEIDISETYSRYPNLSVPFLHYSADLQGPVAGLNTAYCSAPRGVYNTYTLVWSASRLSIYVNGKLCMKNTSGDSAFQKPYIAALTAALGVGANTYDGRAPVPATTRIDYLRIWK